MRVLVVEDDALIAEGVVAGLAAQGFDARCVRDGASAQAACVDEDFDALVLDLGLPDTDGLALLAALRAQGVAMPVVVLTARDAIEHRLAGLHGGADDYLVKPFDLRELAARLHAVVRRSRGRAVPQIQAGPLRIEPHSGLAWLDGDPVALSRREIDVLVHLADARGRWVAPEVLHERLYGLDSDVGSNALNVHIHNIRRKLGTDAIRSERGLGYRLGWEAA
ncbi:response regulator [Novilysobacter selenitireducens]|uniref:Response regulator n=1 Tax=Novilysobacter selenitireducens TaxID=2872639 RepID=A0ABS7T8C2_9GAMM|nr:response regulator [Lysobacter selenitireducens]MBZ4040134.1 response regulator [Lysobacter selenitireducens]